MSPRAPATPVAAFVITIPKIGGLAAVYRLVAEALPGVSIDWPLLLAILATASMTLGNLAAVFQDNVRRLLAYSTISQVGYLLMAVAVATRSQLALPGLLFYLAAYAVTNLGAFAVVAEFPHATRIEDYRGLARRHPGLALVLVVCLLGLVGTPPTAVFLGKLEVFAAAIDGRFTWLAAVAVVNTVASLFYYLRWVAPVFPAGGRRWAPTPPSRVTRTRHRWRRGAPAGSGPAAALTGVRDISLDWSRGLSQRASLNAQVHPNGSGRDVLNGRCPASFFKGC